MEAAPKIIEESLGKRVLRVLLGSIFLGSVMAVLWGHRVLMKAQRIGRRGRFYLSRVRQPIPVTQIFHDAGYCYGAEISGYIPTDRESESRGRIFEDGQPLLHAHVRRDFIRSNGRGTFQHWNKTLYFSASDNSDPRCNRRTYTFVEE